MSRAKRADFAASRDHPKFPLQAGGMSARERIEEVLDSIRPAIRADGGDVELLEYDESSGVVEVRLMGACESCPISMMTLKEGIEKRLRSSVPGVVEVSAI
jgi:Fe-S cluster biogenesis protein NfuA